jgi:hypothetical protein
MNDFRNNLLSYIENRIGGVMVSVLASSAIDRGFESQSGQAKDNKIGICCFSAKNAALRRKSKETGKCVRVGRHVYPRTACFIKLTL